MEETKYFLDYKMGELKKKLGFDEAWNLVCLASKEQLEKILAFTKEDLKPGMVVEFRNEELGVVLPLGADIVILSTRGRVEGIIANEWEGNLIASKKSHNWDINKVYGFYEKDLENFKITKDDKELLWERKTPKKMTVAEVKKIVENDIGEEIQVVDRVLNNKIVIMGTEFTDIDKAINYLRSLKLRNSRLFKKSRPDPKYYVSNRFFFEDLCGLKNVIGTITSLSTDGDRDYILYGITFSCKTPVNLNTIMLNEKELDKYGKKINC